MPIGLIATICNVVNATIPSVVKPVIALGLIAEICVVVNEIVVIVNQISIGLLDYRRSVWNF
jgi:hypothetical protein